MPIFILNPYFYTKVNVLLQKHKNIHNPDKGGTEGVKTSSQLNRQNTVHLTFLFGERHRFFVYSRRVNVFCPLDF